MLTGDHRRPCSGELRQRRHQFRSGATVEHGERLVEHQGRRAPAHDARQRQSLLLAARERAGVPAPQRGQPKAGQRLLQPRLDLRARQAQILQAKDHLVFDRRRQQLRRRILEHHPRALGELP